MLLALLVLAAAQSATPGPQCSISDRPVVRRTQDLPAAVLKALPTRMANPGEAFHVTDVIAPGTEQLPWLRLICGYPIASGYVIEREQGGRGYNIGQIRFRKRQAGYVAEASVYGTP